MRFSKKNFLLGAAPVSYTHLVLRAARRTGLEKVLPRLIRSLSKGYKQRVGIAQALLGLSLIHI